MKWLIGLDKTINAQIFLKIATYKTVSWKSSDAPIAAVEKCPTIEESKIIDVGIDETITKAIVDGNKFDSCEVQINQYLLIILIIIKRILNSMKMKNLINNFITYLI